MIGLLYRIFANFATLRDYELLRGFLLGDVREVNIVFVRELENPNILSLVLTQTQEMGLQGRLSLEFVPQGRPSIV